MTIASSQANTRPRITAQMAGPAFLLVLLRGVRSLGSRLLINHKTMSELEQSLCLDPVRHKVYVVQRIRVEACWSREIRPGMRRNPLKQQRAPKGCRLGVDWRLPRKFEQ